MLHALSAATSALDLLKSLTATKSQSAGNKQQPKSPFDLSGSTEALEGSPARSGAGSSRSLATTTLESVSSGRGTTTL